MCTDSKGEKRDRLGCAKLWLARRSLNHRSIALVSAFVVSCSASVFAAHESSGVTIADLLGRTTIASFSISPDGNSVAFLGVRALPLKNQYDVTLYMQKIDSSERRRILTHCLLPASEVYEKDTHAPLRTLSQYLWSADSKQILYTLHTSSDMAVAVEDVATQTRKIVLARHEHVEIEDVTQAHSPVVVKTFDYKRHEPGNGFPLDTALLMKDSYRFDFPLSNPKVGSPIAVESWQYGWGVSRATPVLHSKSTQYWPYPDEYYWNGHSLEIRFKGALPGQTETVSTAVADPKPPDEQDRLNLEVQLDGTLVKVCDGGVCRDLYKDTALLVARPAEKTDQTRKTYLSRDQRRAVLLRSTNLVPDELVKVELPSGKTTVLFAPNEEFRRKTQGVSVRVMTIPVAEGKMNGRLFVPAGDDGKTRYPLVFTTYLSTPGFNLGSFEVPILPLVAHRIAVFALDARNANEVGHGGDFEPQLRRMQRPLEAIEWVIERLTKDGLIDPDRVGVSGLSYGAEISMYVYWKSHRVRTISAATGSWEPSWAFQGGLEWSAFVNDNGLPDATVDGFSKWKQLSAGLNARPDLPPLLWQAPDEERLGCVESWVQLRRAGAQVEWLEYPDEGHVKSSPANIWWVHERNLDWFRFWLKDEEDPDSRKAEQYVRWRSMRTRWETARARATN